MEKYTVFISRALRLADLIDLLYRYENRNPSSTSCEPLLSKNKPGEPYIGVHDLDKNFFKRHFGDDFVKMLEGANRKHKVFLEFEEDGSIRHGFSGMKSDLMGTRNGPSKAAGEGVKKAFLDMIEVQGYDENGRSKAIKKIYETNRETLSTFLLEAPVSLRHSLSEYIDGVPAAEDSLKLPNGASMRYGAVKKNLESLLKFCREPLEAPYETDEECTDACAEALTWLIVGAFLRTKIADRKIVHFYKPEREDLHFSGKEHVVTAPELKDAGEELRMYLDEILEQKRKRHPSFQLMAVDTIDSRLYPKIKEFGQIKPMGSVHEGGSTVTNRDNCPVREIIRDSWSASEHRSVVIIGEGGIGKTVTLFSIAGKQDGALPVPALYVPMYELVDKDGNVSEFNKYIRAKYDDFSDRILRLVTEAWDEKPRLLLLLDGFNEIPFSLRRDALDVVNEWQDTYPGTQVIAVSRPMDGLNLVQELGGDPLPIELVPLGEDLVRAYLKEVNRKIPAKGAPIWADLRYPLFLNLYIKNRGLTKNPPSGYPLRVMDADSGGALIWNFLQRELLRHRADKNEKAERWVLRCAVANEYILPYLAHRMVSEQRMEISYDEAVCWTDEAMARFDNKRLPQHLNAVWETYRQRHHSLPEKDIFQPNVWRDTVLRDSGILIPLVKHVSEDDITRMSSGNYVFMHQHFRDCLAGLYLVNKAEAAEASGLPRVWKGILNPLALDYAAELMDNSTAKKLWEINRLKMQYSSPDYVEDHTGTCALLELQRRRNPIPQDLDFSGMDLRGLSLTRYMGQDDNNLSLFQKSHLSRGTKMNRPTFQNEGHFSGVLSVLVLPNGYVVSGSYDHSLRVWNPSSGQCLRTLIGHTREILCIAAFPDGRIVSGSNDHSLRIWDSYTGECLKILEGHTDGVSCVTVLDDGNIVSGSYDHSLRVWDPLSGQCLRTLV